MKPTQLSKNEIKIIQSKILEKTGITLKPYLLEQAFTRSSWSKSYGGGNNENFEYIGDTILSYHVVHYLFEHYGTIHADEDDCFYSFRAHEKDFTSMKNKIVCNSMLAKIMDEWNLCRYLVVGKSDFNNKIDEQEKIKADLLESIIGAIAVQSKWNPATMEKVIEKILPLRDLTLEYDATLYRPPKFSSENAINTLKELAEHEKCSVPKYDFSGPESLGYDKNGNPRWSCRCTILEKTGIIKTVFANSKKDAKKFSAYLVLCELFELHNEYGISKNLLVWYYDGKNLTVEPTESFKFI